MTHKNLSWIGWRRPFRLNVTIVKILIVSGGVLTSVLSAAAADLNLIPWPAKLQRLDGQFSLDEKTVVTADAPFTQEAALLAARFHLPTAATTSANRIRLTTEGAQGLGDEAYRLEVDTHGATIHARTAASAFYGVQTLAQMVEPKSKVIPFVTIEDAPRYAWRGLMLDVSRHFFDKTTILQLLDWMADYKLNRFHIHLTDDQAWRLEIGKYPELTKAGARGNFTDSNAPARFFTKAEMQEIIAYAAARHIVVVPEIDMPGHASAATRIFPAIDGGAKTFNPGSAATFDFLQNVLRDVMQTFPSPWIHFGGDEVNTSGWKKNPDAVKKMKTEGFNDPRQLEGDFVRRMTRFITEQGRTPMGWDEIVAAKPATNTVVFWWRHNQPEMLAQALAAGHAVVLTPRSPCYFDYPQDPSYPQIGWKLCNTPELVYRGPLIPTNIPPAQLKQILGVEACVWTEHIATVPYLEFMLLPRMVALAEMAWTPDDRRDFAQFDARLKPHLDEYRQLGIHFYDEANPADVRAIQSGLGFLPRTKSVQGISTR